MPAELNAAALAPPPSPTHPSPHLTHPAVEIPLGDQPGSSSGGGDAGALRVFSGQPYRVYTGHKQDVLDLCWSKTNVSWRCVLCSCCAVTGAWAGGAVYTEH